MRPEFSVERYRTKDGVLLWRIANGRYNMLLDDENMNTLLDNVERTKNHERAESR
ncbi:hypothetical protein CVAR21S_01878 [Corynebacterium variabile]